MCLKKKSVEEEEEEEDEVNVALLERKKMSAVPVVFDARGARCWWIPRAPHSVELRRARAA